MLKCMLALVAQGAMPSGRVLSGFGSQPLGAWLWARGLRVLIIAIVALLLIWMLRLMSRRIATMAAGSAGHNGSGREQQIHTLVAVLDGAFTTAIVIIALFQILEQLGIAIGPLLAGAGVAGLAIGFGAQTLVKDLITGFFILLDDQYRVGDSIKAASVQGKVERLTLRRTVLRDADGTLHFIPNSAIQVVSNLTRDWNVAVLRVAVHYREDSDRVIAALRAAGDEVCQSPAVHDRVLGEVTVPGIDRISGDEVDYLLQLRTLPGAQADVLRALRAAVKRHLASAGVEAWYPQINLPNASAAAGSA